MEDLTVSSSQKTIKGKVYAGLPLSIASYNLWNTNANWEERTKRIAKLIQTLDPTVIAFQEVRTLDRQSSLELVRPYQVGTTSNGRGIPGTEPLPARCRVQITLLQDLLPDYKWAVYSPMAGFNDGTQEGVAVSLTNSLIGNFDS